MTEEDLSFSPEFQEQPLMYGDYFTTADHSTPEHTNQICNSGKGLPPPSQSPQKLETPLKRTAEKRCCAAAPMGSYNFTGYKKVDLPHSFPAAPLRRTASLPIPSSANFNFPLPPLPYQESPTSSITGFDALPQGTPVRSRYSGQEAHQSPNSPLPVLQRTLSDQTVISGASQRPRTCSPPGSSSPSAKRLRKIEASVKQIKNWCEQVFLESNDEEIIKEQDEENTENSSADEAVSVEEKGDLLALRFKCTCGREIEVLLSGKSCYYKLTT